MWLITIIVSTVLIQGTRKSSSVYVLYYKCQYRYQCVKFLNDAYIYTYNRNFLFVQLHV